MKVVVFGGAGFLGSHVADELTKRGHQVTIFDLKESEYRKEGQKTVIGDINDYDLVEKTIKGQDCVYGFAGIADMDEARNNPLETVRNNILGNAVLLDISRKCGIKRFIFASTLYVYSKAGSFYRSCKQACELLIENYHEIYDLDFTILRYGSLYGPRSGEGNWIYHVLKQALTENKISRHGDGEELREYIHVNDAARLSVDILDEKYKNQYIIVAGNQQIRIKDLMIMIREIMDNKIKLEYLPVASDEHYEITPYCFNPKLAKRILNSNYVDLGQGILDLLTEILKKLGKKRENKSDYI